MNGWMIFWTVVYIVACSSGLIMALIIIPYGIRDMVHLYRLLSPSIDTGTDPIPLSQPETAEVTSLEDTSD